MSRLNVGLKRKYLYKYYLLLRVYGIHIREYNIQTNILRIEKI